MELVFREKDHKYYTPDQPELEWISVTTVIGKLHEKFEPEEAATKSSKNRKSKWYKLSEKEILQAWEDENKRSIELGSFYHNKKEAEYNNNKTLAVKGKEVPVFIPQYTDELKLVPEQKLQEGVYPEHMTYIGSVGICGQADLVQVADGYIHIEDHKTCKEIVRESYVSWEGESKKLLPPVAHIQDSNYWHYALQLSIYAYAIQRHNLQLRVGDLMLNHVLFEVEGENKYGYPIHRKDKQGNPIVKDIVQYKMPYLKAEVISIVNWLKSQK